MEHWAPQAPLSCHLPGNSLPLGLAKGLLGHGLPKAKAWLPSQLPHSFWAVPRGSTTKNLLVPHRILALDPKDAPGWPPLAHQRAMEPLFPTCAQPNPLGTVKPALECRETFVPHTKGSNFA